MNLGQLWIKCQSGICAAKAQSSKQQTLCVLTGISKWVFMCPLWSHSCINEDASNIEQQSGVVRQAESSSKLHTIRSESHEAVWSDWQSRSILEISTFSRILLGIYLLRQFKPVISSHLSSWIKSKLKFLFELGRVRCSSILNGETLILIVSFNIIGDP